MSLTHTFGADSMNMNLNLNKGRRVYSSICGGLGSFSAVVCLSAIPGRPNFQMILVPVEETRVWGYPPVKAAW